MADGTLAGTDFRTSELYFAAFLKAAKVPFKGTTKEGPRVYFLFEPVEGLRDLRTQYFNSTAKVVASDFVNEIKILKTLLYMETDTGS